MEKTTLNPFENAKRTAKGSGGGSVTPEQIEQLQSEINVLGSENRTQTQDIADIKAQLADLASAYSTTEHKIGRKSADNKDIYEKSVIANDVTLTTSTAIDATLTTASVDTVEKIFGTMKDSDGNIFENYMYYDAGQLLRATPILTSSGLTLLINGLTVKAYNITVQYTKPTV